MTLLLDPICETVEQRWYPGLPNARAQPWAEMLWNAARLTGITLALTLLFLPLYLILLFFPPFNLFVFFGLNGYLLGREYFEVAAARRLESGEARAAVIISDKPGVWIAGADIEEFGTLSTAEDGERLSRGGHELLGRLERLPIPVIAAIDSPSSPAASNTGGLSSCMSFE